MMSVVAEAEGRLDILVNNAGITRYRAFDAIGDSDLDAAKLRRKIGVTSQNWGLLH